MKKTAATLSLCSLLLAGCSLNPFNRNRPQPTPTLAPLPTEAPISELRQQLEQQTGRTLPTIAPSPTGQPTTVTTTPGATATQPIRHEVALQPAAGVDGRGYVNRIISPTRSELTILADLPELPAGRFYQVWLVRGQAGQPDYELVKAGRLRSQKGGFILDYSVSRNLTDHRQVLVTQEATDDNISETLVLSGTLPATQ